MQLLHKFSVRAEKTSIKLLKVIKNPITDHLPVGCRKIGTSFSSDKTTHPSKLVPENDPIVFVVGAMAHGHVSQFFSLIVSVFTYNIIFSWNNILCSISISSLFFSIYRSMLIMQKKPCQ